MSSPDGKTTEKRFAEMSVDDSRQGVNKRGVKLYNANHGTDITLNQAVKQANQVFERYLALTWGHLAIEKNMFYVLSRVGLIDGT